MFTALPAVTFESLLVPEGGEAEAGMRTTQSSYPPDTAKSTSAAVVLRNVIVPAQDSASTP